MFGKLLTTVFLLAGLAQAAEWPQFGGPNRDFVVESKRLPSAFPAGGPKKLWTRDLGEGYSGIVVDGHAIFTLYRTGNNEVVLSAEARTGKTLWEHKYAAPFSPGMKMENGPGPHATPLISGDLVFTTGILAHLYALDKKTGRVAWFKDLWKEFPGSSAADRGYACSPVGYKDLVIVQLGGPNHAVVALRQKDGSLAWASQSFSNAPTSPQIINVSGQDQLVTYMSDQIIGMDPNNGALLWSHPHQTDWGLNISLPVFGPDNILVLSSAYSGGSRALQLTRAGNKSTVRELWAHKQFRVHHGTMLRVGDYVYGSSGDFGPAPFTAVNVKTGAVAWRDRALPKTNFVYADNKLLIVSEDGDIAIAAITPSGLKISARAPLLRSNAWTAPALVGTTLYVRDRKSLAAVSFD